MTTITRPAFRWYGGGWGRGAWTIQHFPPHDIYIEPCFGAGSVLLQKRRAKIETVNDLDGKIVNFFKVLRESKDRLIELIELTPWARDEFEVCKEPSDDPLEAARRFYFICQASYGGGGKYSQLRVCKKRTDASIPSVTYSHAQHLHAVADRLMGVQIENRDCREIIEEYGVEGSLIYFDPPYLARTRANPNAYSEDADDSLHVEAARLLRQSRAHVIISGYSSELYDELYPGWEKVDKRFMTNGGGYKTECLWLSPSVSARRQRSLFEQEHELT